MKNTLDNAFGILAWFLLGNALSGGPYGTGNGYVGTAWRQTVKQWTSVEEVPQVLDGTISSHPDALWSFYFAFASSAATIVSGAIAERAQMRAHLVLSVCMCGVIYPIAAYWVWGNDGWLSGLSGVNILLFSALFLSFARQCQLAQLHDNATMTFKTVKVLAFKGSDKTPKIVV